MSNPETNPRYASSATTDGFTADGNAGAAKGGDLGSKTLAYVKEGIRGSENLRQGINSFADNTIQPSAARDADRGVTEQHRKNFRPSDHGTDGHDVLDGPARGTGTSGFGQRHDAFEGTPASTSSSGGTGVSGFSRDAQNVMEKAKEAWRERTGPKS